jgi:hypothetical protein
MGTPARAPTGAVTSLLFDTDDHLRLAKQDCLVSACLYGIVGDSGAATEELARQKVTVRLRTVSVGVPPELPRRSCAFLHQSLLRYMLAVLWSLFCRFLQH